MFPEEPVLVYNLYPQFEEIAQLTAETLRSKGHEVSFTKYINPSVETLHILFGVNVWEDCVLLPQRFIVYQLEQHPIKRWFIPPYFARMQHAEQVWDYNRSNVEYLHQRGIDAIHVPLGYTPLFSYHLEKDKPSKEEVKPDLLFLGTLNNPHRQRILEGLREAGLPVFSSNNYFGERKKELVERSKVVLNLHHGQEALLEEARIIPLLAQGKVVISESVQDPHYMELYKDCVIFCKDLPELVQKCREWLSKSKEDYSTHSFKVREWIMTKRKAVDLFPDKVIYQDRRTNAPFHYLLSQVPKEVKVVSTPKVCQYHREWEVLECNDKIAIMRRKENSTIESGFSSD